MRIDLGQAAVAAVVGALVAAASLALGRRDDGGRAEIARTSEDLASVTARLDAAERAAAALRAEQAALADRLGKAELAAAAAKRDSEAASLRAKESAEAARAASAASASASAGGAGAGAGGAAAATPEPSLDESFADLAKVGMNLFRSPRYGELVERLKALGDEGRAFVMRGLDDPDEEKRFAAAALAEALKDPAFIDPLERTALDDASFMVRRMASHALAFMGAPESGDALTRIVDGENRDPGVRLNAWYGLATQGRAEAFTLYERVLDHSGGEVTADFVAATAMQIRDPRMLPLLEKTYARPQVSDGVKAMIVRALAAEPAHRAFVEAVARDPATPEVVRDAAEEALRR